MGLTPGTRVGSYQVVALMGAAGLRKVDALRLPTLRWPQRVGMEAERLPGNAILLNGAWLNANPGQVRLRRVPVLVDAGGKEAQRGPWLRANAI
jgi:hypothetical protein